jgi:hypothetical protein
MLLPSQIAASCNKRATIKARQEREAVVINPGKAVIYELFGLMPNLSSIADNCLLQLFSTFA